MKLLAPIPPAELPAEALLARIRTRRSNPMLRLANAGHASAESVSLQAALDWVFVRLDRCLRPQLEPYLQILAVRVLDLALRYRLAGDSPPTHLLQGQMLNPALKDQLRDQHAPETLLRNLEQDFANDCPYLFDLAMTLRQKGPGGVEAQLNSGVLQHSLATARNQTMRLLVRYLIDMRNLLGVLKYWRWQTRIAPELAPGGDLACDTLYRVWANGDRSRCLQLIHQVSRLPVTTDQPREVEQLLYRGLSLKLARAGRDPLSLAVIVDYLWRVQIAACNQILHQTVGHRQDLLEEALLA